MQNMLIALISILSSACLSYVLFQMIQPDQILGGWQKVLDKVYSKSIPLAMLLGHCYKCFAHLIGLIGFILYLWVQYNINWLGWWNVLIYLGFVPAVIVVSLFINKHLSEDVV